MQKVIRVCPDCQSPYLETNVLAAAKINSNFDWELEYQFPQDLSLIIEQPGTDISCTHCDWVGTWAETLEITGTALDGLQYDNGSTAPSPMPFIKTPQMLSMKQLPEIKMGMQLLISDPRFIYNDVEMLVIGSATHPCRYVTEENGQRIVNVGKFLGFVLTPADTDQYQDAIQFITGPQLLDLHQRGQLQILTKEQKPLPMDSEDATPDEAPTEPLVRFIPS